MIGVRAKVKPNEVHANSGSATGGVHLCAKYLPTRREGCLARRRSKLLGFGLVYGDRSEVSLNSVSRA
jgi:hypothetical protein